MSPPRPVGRSRHLPAFFSKKAEERIIMSTIRKMLDDGRDYYLKRADRDIEKYRKGDFAIKITENGEPLNGARVSYKMKKIDFEFGCNIFMVDQYDDAERQNTYYEQWKRLFNTAVVPLYWEGTEPEKGRLRYSKDVPNDIYRRPAADRVVEYCKENGLGMKGHPLFWHEFIPKWLPDDWDELLALIEKRFKEISERYSEDISVFDCVNEPGRIWDMTYEHRTDGYKMVTPPAGYLEQVFALGKKYFPNNTLILNEAVGSAVCEFKGIYGSYYQLVKRLLSEGLKIDRLGIQCHCSDNPYFQNVYNARRLYGVMDGYSELGCPIVLSEIGLSCDDEELQAEAVEQLYKICFSVDKMSGIFWWNLDDDGIITTKNRSGALGENLPSAGLCRMGREKAAYKTLDRLINREWTTSGCTETENGAASFKGFYGDYEITVEKGGVRKVFDVSFAKGASREFELAL